MYEKSLCKYVFMFTFEKVANHRKTSAFRSENGRFVKDASTIVLRMCVHVCESANIYTFFTNTYRDRLSIHGRLNIHHPSIHRRCRR